MIELNAVEMELLAKVRQAEMLQSAAEERKVGHGLGVGVSRLFRR